MSFLKELSGTTFQFFWILIGMFTMIAPFLISDNPILWSIVFIFWIGFYITASEWIYKKSDQGLWPFAKAKEEDQTQAYEDCVNAAKAMDEMDAKQLRKLKREGR